MARARMGPTLFSKSSSMGELFWEVCFGWFGLLRFPAATDISAVVGYNRRRPGMKNVSIGNNAIVCTLACSHFNVYGKNEWFCLDRNSSF